MEFHFNSDKDEESFQYLAQANNTSEWLWKIYSKFGIMGFFIGHWTTAAISLLICFLIRGNFNSNYVYHPYKAVLVLK